MPTYMLARVTLKDKSQLRTPRDASQDWRMVVINGKAVVAAGTEGCNRVVTGEVKEGASYQYAVDWADWEEFEASKMEEGTEGEDEVFNTLRDLWPGSVVLLQLELDYRFRRSAGRLVLGFNIIQAKVEYYPPAEETEKYRVPVLMTAAANGKRR